MAQIQDVFVFNSYSIQSNKKEIHFTYTYQTSHSQSTGLSLIEKVILPKEIPADIPSDLLHRLLQNLHLMLGVSYYKMYCANKIITPYLLSKAQANFWNITYTKGLGELFYRNTIDFRGLINFPYDEKKKDQPIVFPRKNRVLIGVGGGKDSVVAVEILKKQNRDITGFVLENGPDSKIQRDVIKTMSIDHLVVKRFLDEKLLKPNQMNHVFYGHVPVSAIYAFIGLLLAVLYDYSSIVTANEKSANFGNIDYLGVEINHQWSKSEEFEVLFKRYVQRCITPNVNYFSVLRNYSEMEIVKRFVQFKNYFPVFSSCNINFRIDNKMDKKKWCGKCPKCAFVFITLSAYLPKEKVIKIFKKNLLGDQSLTSLYIDLIGRGTMKPFDCVGTFDDAKEAFKAIHKKGDFEGDTVMKSIQHMV